MLIDCETCSVRGTGCSDCVVSLFLGTASSTDGGAGDVSGIELDASERRALHVLADAGLAPPLRMEQLVRLARTDRVGPPPDRPGDVAAAG